MGFLQMIKNPIWINKCTYYRSKVYDPLSRVLPKQIWIHIWKIFLTFQRLPKIQQSHQLTDATV